MDSKGVVEKACLKYDSPDHFNPTAKIIHIEDVSAWRWPNQPFDMTMRTIRDACEDGSEQAHILMDDAMCDLLDTLGYEEGVKIFRESTRRYS